MKRLKIGKQWVGDGKKPYWIADISANWMPTPEQKPDIRKAFKLIDAAKQAGADVAKFQTFQAPKIVSDVGFKSMKITHQAKWKKSVYEVYEDASLKFDWHQKLANYCKKVGIEFMSTPYDKESVDLLEKVDVNAYKIGSGDIDYIELLTYIAKKRKPIIISSGASDLATVELAINTLRKAGNDQIILLQCITNYALSPIEQAGVEAMVTMGKAFDVAYGYSDHTYDADNPFHGVVVPLIAVTRGACVIEKHLCLRNDDETPDAPFSMTPQAFALMTKYGNLVKTILGSGQKQVVAAETDSSIIQRRCLRAARDLKKGTALTKSMVEALRPTPKGSITPQFTEMIIGKKLTQSISRGEAFAWKHLFST
ncbi:N-acetylneuraminate synthase family protein [Candidatus Collierbacteria bacterium]|nr:N-acetylneuraminate synthase family protein [Candidatus Collierbacteria bacterium]